MPLAHIVVNTLYNFIHNNWWDSTERYGYGINEVHHFLGLEIEKLFVRSGVDTEYLQHQKIIVPSHLLDLSPWDDTETSTSFVEILPKFYSDPTLREKRQAIMEKLDKKLPEIGEESHDDAVKTATAIRNTPNPDADDVVPKYGTYRNLTTNDVRKLVKDCRAFMDEGGTIASFYESKVKIETCSINTFRIWMKNPKFRDSETTIPQNTP